MLTYLLGIKLKSRPGCHVVAAAAVVLALNLPLLRQPAQGQVEEAGGRGTVSLCGRQSVRARAGRAVPSVQHTMAATTATYKFIWPWGMLKLCHQIGINRARDAAAPLLPACLPDRRAILCFCLCCCCCFIFATPLNCQWAAEQEQQQQQQQLVQRQFVCDV